ncbi:UPF0415 protein C7orf25 homolog isoform X2 [Apostichopus japonicus]|uniref:UPF0415 protein C7orf25 homolog isoform X2 n=1 Tax=Stichopus japonicus TaxID=307972 RepID=UPI003AB403EC
MELSEEEKNERVDQLLKKADELLGRVDDLKEQLDHSEGGYSKLIGKIEAEKSFVSSLLSKDTPVKENSLRSTNLIHLEALTYTAENIGHVTRVMSPLKFLTQDQDKINIVVDVIGQNGKVWVKVTARNAEALHRTWLDGGDYGDHDIVQQVQFYQLASQQNPVGYTHPKVHVVFYNGVTQDIVDELSELGVTVHGHIFNDIDEAKTGRPTLPVFPGVDDQEESTSESGVSNKPLVNMDVTTLIALVSELSHGGCTFSFKESYIEDLAKQERKTPFLSPMEDFIKNKDLIVCKTALRDFQNILDTIAGPNELARAKRLLKRIRVVEDQLSARSETLTESNRIKRNSKITFGTGDALGAITTTGNVSFIKAARRKGVAFLVHTHQSRALTEKKQSNPEKVLNPQMPTHVPSLFADSIHVELAEEIRLGGGIGVDLFVSSLKSEPMQELAPEENGNDEVVSWKKAKDGIEINSERAPSLGVVVEVQAS